ncbi:MAG: hypothetical protein K8I60_17005 [Anaerolineae bacterium]|nr:hypothetical protein [Anaerolineae bacterium]
MLRKVVGLLMLVWVMSVPALAQEPADGRILALQLNLMEGEDYNTVFALGCAIGSQTVVLSQDWTDLEPAPGEYALDILTIANLFYPAYDMPVDLMIRPVHTNTLQLPTDLAALPLDDPQVIARYEALLDQVFGVMGDVRIASLSVGSETDIYLNTDVTLWEQYTRFAAAIRDYMHQHYPDTPVVFEMTSNGLTGSAASLAQALNEYADIIGVSYYPITDDFTVHDPAVVRDLFAALVDLYPDKPISFYQIGYPSSPVLNSSEAAQAQFIREVFQAWDIYADHVRMVDFTWLTDIPAEQVAFYQEYYHFATERFGQYLGTLGLRYHDGTPKQALDVLTEEAHARGWGDSCSAPG